MPGDDCQWGQMCGMLTFDSLLDRSQFCCSSCPFTASCTLCRPAYSSSRFFSCDLPGQCYTISTTDSANKCNWYLATLLDAIMSTAEQVGCFLQGMAAAQSSAPAKQYGSCHVELCYWSNKVRSVLMAALASPEVGAVALHLVLRGVFGLLQLGGGSLLQLLNACLGLLLMLL